MPRRGKSSVKWKLVDWNGEQVKRKAVTASRKGIDETMSKCVIVAKGRVRVKTATLQGSLRMEPAVVLGQRIKGTWGSFDVNYALWQEIGTSRMSGQPYLRPAADAEYPQLKARIKANFAGMP